MTQAFDGGPLESFSLRQLSSRPTRTHVRTTGLALPRPADPGGHLCGTLTGCAAGYPRGVAVTPDGRTLLVATEFDDGLDVVHVDPASGAMTVAQQLALGLPAAVGGSYPYAVAVGTNPVTGAPRAYITAEGRGQVLVAEPDLSGWWSVVYKVAVGDHPTGLAVSPGAGTVLMADANDDTVSVLDPRTLTASAVLIHAVRGEAVGSVPDAVAFGSPTRAYVALAGDDAVAVLDRGPSGWAPSGFVPTGWYPTAVGVDPSDGSVLAVAAKGLGSRYLPGGAYPIPGGSPAQVPTSYHYDGSNMPSLLNRFPPPSAAELATGTETVSDAITRAAGAATPSPDNPVPAPGSPRPSPITHVVYIVRENRTFDQVLGDLGRTRTDVDADPTYELLASSVPNDHAIAARYAFSDNFFSDGEASVQGHFWTTSADTSDYTEKAWRQYYSPRHHPEDTLAPITVTPGCSLFQSALARSTASAGAFTLRDYGEFVGAANADAGADPVTSPCVPGNPLTALGYLDTAYYNQLTDPNLDKDDRVSAAEFLTDIGIDANGASTGARSGAGLRNLSYLTLPEDHTTGLNGTYSPRAEVAQNDAALGTIVSALSKSSYWSSTAVFVIEDDSQDGVDHVDGHRNVLLVASPYTKHVAAGTCYPGYVSHVRYDQAGVVRTIELILGLPALASYDQNAAPLYDLFQDEAVPTPADLSPYQSAPAPAWIDEAVRSLPSTPSLAVARGESSTLAPGQDRAGPGLEDVLWRTATSRPVPPALSAEVAAASGAGGGGGRTRAHTTGGDPAQDDQGRSGGGEAGHDRAGADPPAAPLHAIPAAPAAPPLHAKPAAPAAPPLHANRARATTGLVTTSRTTGAGQATGPITFPVALAGRRPESCPSSPKPAAGSSTTSRAVALTWAVALVVGIAATTLAWVASRRRRTRRSPAATPTVPQRGPAAGLGSSASRARPSVTGRPPPGHRRPRAAR